ncbi:MAG TPA: amino acid adenylation domain-containing protein, partial [Thermoanaerobaculia bacterium]|nr:amino acid adenylation domain-containing protein [Thermoanaerobaculia bacterium]
EVRVALLATSGLARVVGALAVLKAGGVYLPLDPDSPAPRLAFQLADARVPIVLTEPGLAARLPEAAATVLPLEVAAPEGPSAPPPARPLGLQSLAYVVYTSGSTGGPKGVEIPHAGLASLVRWHREVYGVTPADRATLLANPAFDAAVWEIWPYLTAGAALFAPSAETRLAPEALVRWLRREEISLTFLPTPLAEAVLDTPETMALPGLRFLLTGGDRLHRGPHPAHPFRLVNHYGPSEASVVTTAGPVAEEPSDPADLPAIGRPRAGTRVLALGPDQHLVPAGVPGELWVGGLGLARGYLGRADLTAERFVPDPTASFPGARLYRTGDRVRWRPDGRLDFLGRFDHQVKVRGFRIELGEVETALLALPGVRAAAVLVREEGLRDKRLVAYVAAEPGVVLANADLRNHLRERLPAAMVPGVCVILPSLPLTPNGKVDRRALAAVAPGSGEPERYVAPRTPAEALLAGIWAELLEVDRVGIEDSFFDLGGHSLLATQVVSRIRRELGVDLPIRALFEAPTVSGLAAWVETALPGVLPGPVQAARGEGPPWRLPLSFAQERLWFLDRLEPGSAVYNVPAAIHLAGRLDRAALVAALGEVVRRHEALRTRFAAGEDGPVECIEPAAPVSLPRIDLSELPAAGRPGEARRLASEEALRPFDLARGPLLRAIGVDLAAEQHLLLLTLHHIVSDGWSLRVLARELGELYTAFVGGQSSPLPELELQYADYAVWQRERFSAEALAVELAYWREQLAGGTSVLDLPLDRPRPPVLSHRGDSRSVHVSEERRRAFQALARRHEATLFMVVLAAFQALLARLAGAVEVSLGTPVAGRNERQTEGLIGFFVNSLVLRTDLSGDPTFEELLRRVRELALSAYAHQELPFEKLVEDLAPQRDLSASPLFQASFALDAEPPPALRLGELEAHLWPTAPTREKFDHSLTLWAEEGQAGLAGTWSFCTDLYDAATIERWTGHFAQL